MCCLRMAQMVYKFSELMKNLSLGFDIMLYQLKQDFTESIVATRAT